MKHLIQVNSWNDEVPGRVLQIAASSRYSRCGNRCSLGRTNGQNRKGELITLLIGNTGCFGAVTNLICDNKDTAR
ncbi:uncharacterized protein METZ01_LOCUS351095 [marine metagenome]|uniref:Uncharacterized protein n=1 Tax=marine metagenome TaxID=408172 RepID=A0A382RNP6_9ZZZZ